MTSGIESSKFLALLRQADALVEAEEKLLEIRFSLARDLLPLIITETLLDNTSLALCTSRIVTQYAVPSDLHMEYSKTQVLNNIRLKEEMVNSAVMPMMKMVEDAYVGQLRVLLVLQEEEMLLDRRQRRRMDYDPKRD